MSQAPRVFITGISSGIGLALSQRYAKEGAIIGGCGLEPPAELPAALPNPCSYTRLDVTDAPAMQAAISDFVQQHGGLDILIACAGISMPKAAFPDFDLGRKVIDINIHGVINAFEPALQQMREQKSGQLVALASFAGLAGLPGMAFYSASKAAVLNYCESLAIDLKPYGIAVSVIAPGFVATPLTQANPHRMPFLMDVDTAAAKIQQAIRKRKVRSIIPWQMASLSLVLQYLPRGLYRRLMQQDLTGLKEQ